MRCADPAGFPSKWRHVISMHGDGRRRPRAPLFNYATIRGGACDGSGEAGGGGVTGNWWDVWRREAGTAGFPGRRSPGGIQRRRRPGEEEEEEVISMATAHPRAHANMRSTPYVDAIAAESMQNLPRTVTFTALLLFQFPLFFFTLFTHKPSLHIKQLSTC